jgi:4-aminobutyrate aminotransferase-like enzyme
MHEAGGLFVADDVRVGHTLGGGTCGRFAQLGVAPDFVTPGKPVGNSVPVAAVLTRRAIVDDFVFARRVFRVRRCARREVNQRSTAVK